MVTTIVSVLTGIPVRRDVAMTGEVTLRGRVLPIGGLKEKVMAAHRAGIKKVLVPAENVQDIKEIPKIILKEIEIEPVEHLDQVLQRALVLPEGRESVFVHPKPDDVGPIAAVLKQPPAPAGAEEDILTH